MMYVFAGWLSFVKVLAVDGVFEDRLETAEAEVLIFCLKGRYVIQEERQMVS